MFQGPKGYIAKICEVCEVHLQYGNSTTKWPFTLFSSKFHSNLYSILFGYNSRKFLKNHGKFRNEQKDPLSFISLRSGPFQCDNIINR